MRDNFCDVKQRLKVDFDKVICEKFLGLNAVYHGFAYMKEYEARGGCDADVEREIAYAKKANLKIARTIFGLGYFADSIDGPFNMDTERMQNFCKWLKITKDNGIDIALECGSFTGSTFFGHEKMDPERDPQKFAEGYYQVLKYLILEKGFTNIKYLSLFIEPTTNERRPIPDGFPDVWSYYVVVVKAIHERLIKGGIRDKVKLVGPNNSERGRHIANAVADLSNEIDIFSGHFYNYVQHWEWKLMCNDFARIVAPTGKPFWMDEYGIQMELLRNTPQYGTMIANIVSASVSAGHQTTLIWTLFDQLHLTGGKEFSKDDTLHIYNMDSFHDGVHRWGLRRWIRDNIPEAGEAYPAWYAYCLLANALGGENVSTCFTDDGSEDYFTTSRSNTTDYVCATKSGDDITVVAVNSNAFPSEIILDTNGGNRTIYRYSFEPWSDDKFYCAQNEPIKMEMRDGKLEDTLPKGGFCVYSTRCDIPRDYE